MSQEKCTLNVVPINVLLESLQQESAECFKSAGDTSQPHDSAVRHAFHIAGIVLDSLAKRLKAKLERAELLPEEQR